MLLHVASSGGHAGEGGRFRRLEQFAMEFAFFALALDLPMPDLAGTALCAAPPSEARRV